MRGLLFLTALSGALASSITLKDCSGGASFFKVKSLDFSPVNPVRGQNGTLHTLYDVPMTVESGTTKYVCSLNGLPVFSETYDLCSQTACPITGGTHDDYSTSAVPDTSGKVSCTIDWRDSAGSQLLCVQMIMTLTSQSPVGRLRGSPARNFTTWHPDLLVSTNLSENKTCPRVDSYDPLWPAIYVLDSSSTSTGSGGSSSGSNGTSTGGSTSGGSSSGSSSVAELRLARVLRTLRGKHHHVHTHGRNATA
jgi:uncharacterized membrane protein YgcG